VPLVGLTEIVKVGAAVALLASRGAKPIAAAVRPRTLKKPSTEKELRAIVFIFVFKCHGDEGNERTRHFFSTT
jgi:hypothetical protein